MKLLFVVCVLLLAGQWRAERVVSKCLKEYLKDVEEMGLDKRYLKAIKDRADGDLALVPPVYRGPQVVLDIGPGAVRYSVIFKHLTQLNIPGIDRRGKSSLDCKYEISPSISKVNLNEVGSRIQAGGKILRLPIITNWLGLMNKQPNTLVILNDMSDDEYYQSAFKSECRSARRDRAAADYCCVPLLPVGSPFTGHELNLESHHFWIENFSIEAVKSMLAAYRKLIHCITPPEQLLLVNTDRMPPLEYWSQLTTFLNISTTSSQLSYLARGGSICEDPKQYLPDSRVAELDQCAAKYADAMVPVVGQEFRSLLLNRLMEPPLYRRRAPNTTKRLILNAGPGTTATRSLHLAMAMLNITSRHFYAFNNTLGPKNLTVHDIDSDMKAFEKDTSERLIYWSDTPVSERWWHLMKYYPNTRVMVTDVKDDTAWFNKRIKEHCNVSDVYGVWSTCTVPIPVDFYLYSPLSTELFYRVHLMKTNATLNHLAFEAYRELIKCAVPPNQLKWIFIADYTPEVFWRELVSFVGVNVSRSQLNDLIAGGVPRCGSTGCTVGGKKVYSGMY